MAKCGKGTTLGCLHDEEDDDDEEDDPVSPSWLDLEREGTVPKTRAAVVLIPQWAGTMRRNKSMDASASKSQNKTAR